MVMRLRAHTVRHNTIANIQHWWHYLDPGMRQILIAFGRSNSTTRLFELKGGSDRP